LYRENALNAIFSELYQYDGLNQLTSMERGQLNGTKTAITGTPSRTQSWTFDALGNFTTQVSDGVTQTRTHNRQNQITSISGATTPVYSANGEMTTDEQGQTLKYDAWGRLVEVKQGSIILASYTHDAINRKVTEGNRALYYSADWQVVEERESGLVIVQTVFSPVYVDALILRDRDTDANGSLDERLFVQQDANFNVTAITNGTTVVERFIQDAYGTPTILTGAWAARTATLFAWVNLHQGGRRDAATGMIDFRNRWLSPSLGRWTRNDPIGFAGGDVNVGRALANNAIGFNDPSGLELRLVRTYIGGSLFYQGHWSLVWFNPTTGDMVIFDGTGGKSSSGTATGTGTTKCDLNGLPTAQEFKWAGVVLLNRTVFYDKYMVPVPPIQGETVEDELRRLTEAFNSMTQVEKYDAVAGPNSNTYLHQLLKNAGYGPVPRPSGAWGWDYGGSDKYDGANYDRFGRRIVKSPQPVIAPPESMFGRRIGKPPQPVIAQPIAQPIATPPEPIVERCFPRCNR
jgi:RHS repeat-associated protein